MGTILRTDSRAARWSSTHRSESAMTFWSVKRTSTRIYWLHELKNAEPLCFTYYLENGPTVTTCWGWKPTSMNIGPPGPKYLDAILGGWVMYHENFKHVGGTTAICESKGVPAKSCKLTTGCTGKLAEACFGRTSTAG